MGEAVWKCSDLEKELLIVILLSIYVSKVIYMAHLSLQKTIFFVLDLNHSQSLFN